MNPYEAKQEARRERLEARAAKLRASGESRVAQAHARASIIPFGQPILIGHHSEGRDRRYRGKIEAGFRAGYGQIQEAGKVAAQAAAVGSGGISSDDPEAVVKLRAELEKAEADQGRMKVANLAIRKHAKAGAEAQVAALAEILPGWPAGALAKLIEPDFCGRIGFADYQLQNNGANIRRIKARIEQLQAEAQRENKVVKAAGNDGIEVVENADANRVQIRFPGKPSDKVRAILKSRGFRWAPSEEAWQRQLNNGARWAAECVLADIAKLEG